MATGTLLKLSDKVDKGKVPGIPLDVLCLCSILVMLNLHLLGLGRACDYVFLPSALKCGQWWRFLTHPFVHVTWYHLLLDGGAFLLLYSGLGTKNMLERLLCVLCCGMGSLGTAWIFSPEIHTQGLCGISGIAHGLMAFSALEMIRDENYGVGMISLFILIFKCLWEVVTGHMLFEFLLFGMCGTPLTACHAGGVTAGMGTFWTLHIYQYYRNHALRVFNHGTHGIHGQNKKAYY